MEAGGDLDDKTPRRRPYVADLMWAVDGRVGKVRGPKRPTAIEGMKAPKAGFDGGRVLLLIQGPPGISGEFYDHQDVPRLQ